MSELAESIGGVPDEPGDRTSATKHRLLRLVGLALLCAVIGLGTWQLVVLHDEVSSLQSQNRSQEAQLHAVASFATKVSSSQFFLLQDQVNALKTSVNRLTSVGTSGFYANESDLLNLESTVTSLSRTVSCLTSGTTYPEGC